MRLGTDKLTILDSNSNKKHALGARDVGSTPAFLNRRKSSNGRTRINESRYSRIL